MPDTRLAVVPRVEITATRVLPAVGVETKAIMLIEVAAPLPVLPLVDCTRLATAPAGVAPRNVASNATSDTFRNAARGQDKAESTKQKPQTAKPAAFANSL